MGYKKSFCIIKKMVLSNGKIANVVMIDSNHEVLEFETREEAEKLASIMTENSDSGWEYVVKEI